MIRKLIFYIEEKALDKAKFKKFSLIYGVYTSFNILSTPSPNSKKQKNKKQIPNKSQIAIIKKLYNLKTNFKRSLVPSNQYFGNKWTLNM